MKIAEKEKESKLLMSVKEDNDSKFRLGTTCNKMQKKNEWQKEREERKREREREREK